MKKILLPLLAFSLLFCSFQSAESSAFVKKLHTAYIGQLRTELGKSFASAMVKFDGACLVYNDPAFDEIKEKGNTWHFKPRNSAYAKYTVCISFIEKDNAKDILKKIRTAIGKGTSSIVKSPLLIFRKDKTIFTLTYDCGLKDSPIEKLLIEEMKKEAATEKSNDFVIVKCGGAMEAKG